MQNICEKGLNTYKDEKIRTEMVWVRIAVTSQTLNTRTLKKLRSLNTQRHCSEALEQRRLFGVFFSPKKNLRRFKKASQFDLYSVKPFSKGSWIIKTVSYLASHGVFFEYTSFNAWCHGWYDLSLKCCCRSLCLFQPARRTVDSIFLVIIKSNQI